MAEGSKQTPKYRYYVSVEVDSQEHALRLKKALVRELPALPVFAEVDKTWEDGEVDDSWEIQ